MKIDLEKGRTTLELSVPDEKIDRVLVGEAVPPLDHSRIAEIIAQGIRTHAPDDIARKRIAILIPDNTRFWARGDLFVPHIVNALLRLGVPEKRLKIIIALGTHAPIAAKQFPGLAGSFGGHTVEILNSANQDRRRLVHVGETSRGTSLHITREAVAAEHIIIFGGILHHLVAGYGGGRKYILPGIAGYDSVQQNHALAITPEGDPHPMVRPATLTGNPVHEDLEEAAEIFLAEKTCTYVAVAANGVGELFHCEVGPLAETFRRGCRRLDTACCVQVPRKGDFALISAGGHRTDGQLYQATKALFNAANSVKEGGEILFVAGCSQGIGNRAFASALATFGKNAQGLGRQLARAFDMPAYVALRLIDLLERFRISLVSDLHAGQTAALGFRPVTDIEAYVDGLKGRGYVIPFAENILPVLKAPGSL